MSSPLILKVQDPPHRFFSHRTLLRRSTLKRWIGAALFHPTAEITVRLVGQREGFELNQTYRGKSYATNILSFDYRDTSAIAGVPAFKMIESSKAAIMGDLVLCCPVIEKESQTQHKTLRAHYAHLIIHGMLHLQGYDHQHEAEAEVMETLENQILTQLGFDPVHL